MSTRRSQFLVLVLALGVAGVSAISVLLLSYREDYDEAVFAKGQHRQRSRLTSRTPSVRPIASETGVIRTLSGQVDASSGTRIAHATVCALKEHDVARRSDACIATDDSGRFSILVPPNAVNHLVASAPGYASRVQDLDLGFTASIDDIAITLEPTSQTISGQVMDANGGFVSNALVTLRSRDHSVREALLSNPEGSFEIAAAPNAEEICAEAEMYSRTCNAIEGPGEDHVLTLTRGSEIVGRVLAATDGKAAAGVSVFATNGDGLRVPSRATRADSEGRFVLEALPAGGYDVVAISESIRSIGQWVTVGSGETSAPLELVATPAVRLTGVVVIDGEPCREGTVDLVGRISAHEKLVEGDFHVDGVLSGRYDVTAHCVGALSQTVSLNIGKEPLRHTWALDRFNPASGSTSDEVQATSSLRVIVENPGTALLSVTAESDGLLRRGQRRGAAFLFQALERGEYFVYVNDDVEQGRRVEISRDEEFVELRLPSPSPGWITGRVIDDHGLPIADAWVAAVRTESALKITTAPAPTLTDEAGAFTLPAVLQVPYTLTVTSGQGDALIAVKGGDDVVVHASAPASLEGRVVTAEGDPVPECIVMYREKHASQGQQQPCAYSKFHLSTLRPGRYVLEVYSPLGSARQEIELAPHAQSNVTILLEDDETHEP